MTIQRRVAGIIQIDVPTMTCSLEQLFAGSGNKRFVLDAGHVDASNAHVSPSSTTKIRADLPKLQSDLTREVESFQRDLARRTLVA